MDKVVITGYGINVPKVNNSTEFHKVLEKGLCTHDVVIRNKSPISSIIAGVIPDDFSVIKGRMYKRMPRATRLAMVAADDAFQMANLSNLDPTRIAVLLGTSLGNLLEIEKYSLDALEVRRFPLHGISIGDAHTLSSSVATHLGTKGTVHTLATGCAASADAILMGKLLLEMRLADACIVGGADSPLGNWTINGFLKMKSIIPSQSVSETGVPFSNKHKGFVMTEGAGILILERESDARRRGVTMYGSIQNAKSNNGHSSESMARSLKETIGGIKPSYVNSQALGIRENDRVESEVHRTLFSYEHVPITSIKGMIGHSFAASGAIQVISSLLSINHGFIPPTTKTTGSGFNDIPIVFETRYETVENVAITTHGNSGNNTCLLVSRI